MMINQKLVFVRLGALKCFASFAHKVLELFLKNFFEKFHCDC